jgi:hypothetical protein
MSNLEKIGTPKTAFSLNLGMEQCLPVMMPHGEFHLQLVDDASGAVLQEWSKTNTLTEDAAKFAAWLFANVNGMAGQSKRPVHGLNGLAVGTGKVTNPAQARHLETEVARVAVTDIVFKSKSGSSLVPSATATNILDFTFKLDSGIANGLALCEMGLVYIPNNTFGNKGSSGYTANYPATPTEDIRDKDILINYLSFGVITKPANSTLNITWRLTF